jgi:hypothetical protein
MTWYGGDQLDPVLVEPLADLHPAAPQLPAGPQGPLGPAGELAAGLDGAPLDLVDGGAVEPHAAGEPGLGQAERPPPSRQLGPELGQQQLTVGGREELAGGHGRLLHVSVSEA